MESATVGAYVWAGPSLYVLPEYLLDECQISLTFVADTVWITILTQTFTTCDNDRETRGHRHSMPPSRMYGSPTNDTRVNHSTLSRPLRVPDPAKFYNQSSASFSWREVMIPIPI
jgi:hypothetical protein